MKSRMFFVLIKTVILLAGSILAIAQDTTQEITTDRPDQSNTPLLIPQGSLQIETGFIKEENSNVRGKFTNYTYNTTLVKFGVNNNFEFRINVGYLGKHDITQREEHSGFGPMAVGLKIKLSDERSTWPQAALITHVNFNTAENSFNDTHTTCDLTLTFSHTLSEKLSLCYNAGINWDGNTGASTFLATGSLGYSITQRLGAFAEFYMEFPEGTSLESNADGGFTYKITPVFQIDASAGLSLNTRKSFISAGMAIRLLK